MSEWASTGSASLLELGLASVLESESVLASVGSASLSESVLVLGSESESEWALNSGLA